jgi:tetratricopeptide (TPR) repeat protein
MTAPTTTHKPGLNDRALRVLEIARSLSDVRAEAQILGLFGAVYRAQGNREQAITFFKQSREGARRAQDRRAELTALEGLGEVFVDQDAEPALNVLEEALTISRELRDRHAEIRILSQLGVALLGLTEPAKAVERFELALALAREVSDRNAEPLAAISGRPSLRACSPGHDPDRRSRRMTRICPR